MSDDLLLNIKKCIETNGDDKIELKKSINKLIDSHFKIKKPLTVARSKISLAITKTQDHLATKNYIFAIGG